VKRKPFRTMRILAPPRRTAGFSLVELMVAMVISLMISAAALGVFVSNKQVYTATEGLGRIQESARMTFELMSRDIREAGGNPCDVRMTMVNVLADVANWWALYDNGILGYDDGGYPGSTAGTDGIQIQFFEDTGIVTSSDMASADAQLVVDDAGDIDDGQILMACGFFASSPTTPVTDSAVIFSAAVSGDDITHATADGNIGNSFSNAANPTDVVFPAGTLLGRLRALQWYVAANADGGTSLYRRQLRYEDTGPELGDPEEIVADVTDMQLEYMNNAGAWTAAPVTAWANVTAVRISLAFEAADSRAGGVEGELITRTLTHVIALRNKL
jgi:type IV pilus assembly protein PilW